MKQKTPKAALARRAEMHARVLAELKDSRSGLTALELADFMDVPRKTADHYLRQLYADGKIHVGSWVRTEVGVGSGGHASKVWKAGRGKDAERPAPEHPRVARARYRAKMRLVIAAKRSKPDSYKPNLANNPFYQLMA